MQSISLECEASRIQKTWGSGPEPASSLWQFEALGLWLGVDACCISPVARHIKHILLRTAVPSHQPNLVPSYRCTHLETRDTLVLFWCENLVSSDGRNWRMARIRGNDVGEGMSPCALMIRPRSCTVGRVHTTVRYEAHFASGY